MKKIYLFLLNSLFFLQSINAQLVRYQDEIFEEVQITYDIIYATNMDIMPILESQETNPVSKDLKLDFYEPVGDTMNIERPLILVFHDGNFLPQVINGSIIGNKTDSSCVEICTQLAKRGFVAASVEYRLGWNPFHQSQQDRALGFVQAIYRAIQDGNTAIRFFRKNYAEEGNVFRINPNKIVTWGHGSGGIISLNMAALSHMNEFLNTTNPPGKLLYDLDLDGVPDIPMILESIHGDIEGKLTTVVEQNLFLFSEGDTSNLSNSPNYSSDFNLAVNISGCLIDTSWLNDNTIPTISYQSYFDPFYPYDNGSYPTNILFDPVIWVQGAQLLGEYQNVLGNDQLWFDQQDAIHTFSMPYTNQAITNSSTIGHSYYQSVFPFLNAPNSIGYQEGIVIDWWNPEAFSPNGIPWNELPHPSGGTFHENALLLNENMSAEKARLTIDSLIGYFIPRACFTLDLNCPIHVDTFPTSTNELLSNFPIVIYPNPTTNFISIDTKVLIIKDIHIYDSKGSLLRIYPSINNSQKKIRLNGLQKGLYFVEIKFNEGMVIRKISIQ